METFGRIVQIGNSSAEGLRPSVDMEDCVTIQSQSDFGLYILYYGSRRLQVEIPKTVKEASLVEWKRRYPHGSSNANLPFWAEWMDSVVESSHFH